MNPLIIIRGGGDLASGVALRLHRVGFQLAILELAKPLAVRRSVCFSEAVYGGMQIVEGLTARLVSADQFQVTLEAGEIPVLIDPNANILRNQFLTSLRSTFLVDARLLKTEPEMLSEDVPLHIGLGPGFRAGGNCHAVIETRRSHTLGRVLWSGESQPDSDQPDGDPHRVLRAPDSGQLMPLAEIGDHVKEGQLIAEIQKSGGAKLKIVSPFVWSRELMFGCSRTLMAIGGAGGLCDNRSTRAHWGTAWPPCLPALRPESGMARRAHDITVTLP